MYSDWWRSQKTSGANVASASERFSGRQRRVNDVPRCYHLQCLRYPRRRGAGKAITRGTYITNGMWNETPGVDMGGERIDVTECYFYETKA